MILDLSRAVSTLEGSRGGPSPGARRSRDRPSWGKSERFFMAAGGWKSGRNDCARSDTAENSLGAGSVCALRRRKASRGLPWPSFARPPATDSGIGGYTGRAQALFPSSCGPGGAPGLAVLQRARPSPVSALKSDSWGLPGASPGLNLTLLQHRFPSRKRKIKVFSIKGKREGWLK